jgi:hypothetical protein
MFLVYFFLIFVYLAFILVFFDLHQFLEVTFFDLKKLFINYFAKIGWMVFLCLFIDVCLYLAEGLSAFFQMFCVFSIVLVDFLDI